MRGNSVPWISQRRAQWPRWPVCIYVLGMQDWSCRDMDENTRGRMPQLAVVWRALPCTLRRFYQKIRYADSSIETGLALRIAQKSLNDTTGQIGLVPTISGYVMNPRFTTAESTLPDQQKGMRVLEVASSDTATVVVEFHVKQALRSRIPPAENFIVTPGYLVRVYREVDRNIHGAIRGGLCRRKESYDRTRWDSDAPQNFSTDPWKDLKRDAQLSCIRNALISATGSSVSGHSASVDTTSPAVPVWIKETL